MHRRTTTDLIVLAIGLLAITLIWVDAPRLAIDQYRMPKELATLLVTGLAAAIALRARERWRADDVALVGMACFAWALLSLALRAENIWLGWRLLSSYWCALLAYSVLRQHAHSAAARTLVLVSIACAGGAVAATTLLEYTGLTEGHSLVHRAPSGLFGHRNHAAHFIVLSLPAALALLQANAREGAFSRQSRVLRATALACVLMGGAAIVVTRSRASWIALSAAVALAALSLIFSSIPRARTALVRRPAGWTTAQGTHRRAASLWLAAVLTGVSLGAVLPSRLDWKISLRDSVSRVGEYDQGSGHGRLIQYATTLSMASANPVLGVGPGNWGVHYSRFARRDDPNIVRDALPNGRLPLSDWLGSLAEIGVPGLAAIITMGLLLALPSLRMLRRRPGESVRSTDVALLMVMAVTALLGALDAVTQTALPALTVAALVAVLARRQLRGRVVIASPQAARMALAGLVCATAFLSYLSARRLAAAVQYGFVTDAAAFRAAAAIDPTDYSARFFAAYGFILEGDCAAARPHLRAARELQPNAPAVASLRRRCTALENKVE